MQKDNNLPIFSIWAYTNNFKILEVKVDLTKLPHHNQDEKFIYSNRNKIQEKSLFLCHFFRRPQKFHLKAVNCLTL